MTPKGIKLLGRIQKIGTVVNAEIMTGICANDILRTERVLHQMKQRLIAMDAVPGSSNSNDDD